MTSEDIKQHFTIIIIINIDDIVILFMHGPNIFFKQEICFHDQVPGQNTAVCILIMLGFSGLYRKQIQCQNYSASPTSL